MGHLSFGDDMKNLVIFHVVLSALVVARNHSKRWEREARTSARASSLGHLRTRRASLGQRTLARASNQGHLRIRRVRARPSLAARTRARLSSQERRRTRRPRARARRAERRPRREGRRRARAQRSRPHCRSPPAAVPWHSVFPSQDLTGSSSLGWQRLASTMLLVKLGSISVCIRVR